MLLCKYWAVIHEWNYCWILSSGRMMIWSIGRMRIYAYKNSKWICSSEALSYCYSQAQVESTTKCNTGAIQYQVPASKLEKKPSFIVPISKYILWKPLTSVNLDSLSEKLLLDQLDVHIMGADTLLLEDMIISLFHSHQTSPWLTQQQRPLHPGLSPCRPSCS